MADKSIDIKEYLGNDDAKTIRNYLRVLEEKLFHVYSLYRTIQFTLIFVIIIIVLYLVYINLF